MWVPIRLATRQTHEQIKPRPLKMNGTGPEKRECAMTNPDSGSPDVLITLVHGTWGRGLIRTADPSRVKRRRARWFEEGSGFRALLEQELTCRSMHAEIDAFLWDGANSIIRRDEAAEQLAKHLVAQKERCPRTPRLIIAHSHGGNVALRAVQQLDPHERHNIHIATLATPFVQVFTVPKSRKVEVALIWLKVLAFFCFAVWLPSLFGALIDALKPESELSVTLPLDIALPLGTILFRILSGWAWIAAVLAFILLLKLLSRNEKGLADLAERTRIELPTSGVRLLVLRAIDDEATLALASGAIANRIISLVTHMLSFGPLYILTLLSPFILMLLGRLPSLLGWTDTFNIFLPALEASIAFSYSPIVLVWVAGLPLAVYGRELALSMFMCEVNSHSVPDHSIRAVRVVTLRSSGGMHHGLYDHPECTPFLVKWLKGSLAKVRKGDTLGALGSPFMGQPS
jgi:hypothetical protein